MEKKSNSMHNRLGYSFILLLPLPLLLLLLLLLLVQCFFSLLFSSLLFSFPFFRIYRSILTQYCMHNLPSCSSSSFCCILFSTSSSYNITATSNPSPIISSVVPHVCKSVLILSSFYIFILFSSHSLSLSLSH